MVMMIDPADCHHLELRKVIITTPDKPLYECPACGTLFKVPEIFVIEVTHE